MCENCNSKELDPKAPKIPGKYYILDRFSDSTSGPYDTREEAEKERKGMNIGEDMVTLRYKGKREAA